VHLLGCGAPIVSIFVVGILARRALGAALMAASALTAVAMYGDVGQHPSDRRRRNHRPLAENSVNEAMLSYGVLGVAASRTAPDAAEQE
jgi:hypothetical protein